MYGLRNSEMSTCLFQFSHKTRQTMLLYAYVTPKVDFKRKFNHHQSFLYEWRLTARTIRKFRIGPSIRSNLESDVRFEIESNHEASQVPTESSQLIITLVVVTFAQLFASIWLFQLQRQSAMVLAVSLSQDRLFGTLWLCRYAAVMFHPHSVVSWKRLFFNRVYHR